MKIVFVSLALLLSTWMASAQTKTFPIDTATKRITFQEKIELPGKTKDELYQLAKNLGISGKNTVKDDAANGTYQYKGQFKVSYPAPQPGIQHSGVVDFLVTIQVKDGKYRYTITNFVHSGDKASGGKLEGTLPECGKHTLTLAGWGTIKRSVMDQTDKLIESIKNKMANVAAPTPGNDW
ncbi:MAG: DUF4468 domain-containing protein [Cytophagaceae bacterium]|jgi:hypothetical protein|nr:DUF4468 domain-containing protein [Cytophagaceae bacterium]